MLQIENHEALKTMLFSRFGRKPTVIICSVGGFIGLFKIFVSNFYAYMALEFLESITGSGLYNVGVILRKVFLYLIVVTIMANSWVGVYGQRSSFKFTYTLVTSE